MINDWFLKLREIDSLLKEKYIFEKNILDEKNRLNKLNDQLLKSCHESEDTKKELFSSQEKLFEIEKGIKTLSTQKENLFSIGKESDHLNPQIDQLESQGLDFLELIENLQQKERDLSTFQKGLQKTISEIQTESNANIEEFEIKIQNIQHRIKLLEAELPLKINETFQRVFSKNPTHGPFSKNENGHCLFCRYKLSKIEESEIDVQKILKQCPQCTRIFLPYGT